MKYFLVCYASDAGNEPEDYNVCYSWLVHAKDKAAAIAAARETHDLGPVDLDAMEMVPIEA